MDFVLGRLALENINAQCLNFNTALCSGTVHFLQCPLSILHFHCLVSTVLYTLSSILYLFSSILCPLCSRGGGSIFAGYVPLASPNPYPIIVYSVANCRPHVSHFWANIPQIPTCWNLLTPEIPQMCDPILVTLNVKKILAVVNATYTVAKRKPEKIRLAGIRTLTSAIPV